MDVTFAEAVKEIPGKLGIVARDHGRIHELYRRHWSIAKNVQTPPPTLKDFHHAVKKALEDIQAGWPTITAGEAKQKLSGSNTLTDRARSHVVNAALCLWLGIDCVGQHGFPKDWPEDDTISKFVLQRKFDDPSDSYSGDSVGQFPPKFRASRLKDISGINIEHTSYLDQHLRFNEDTRTVKIFMDAGWLKAMQKRYIEALADLNNDILLASGQEVDGKPQPLTEEMKLLVAKRNADTEKLCIFEETLRTLDVLFPSWDEKTIEFIDTFSIDGKVVPWLNLSDMAPQQQQGLRKFKYWRARLVELIIEYQAPPRNLKQIWKDRRNPMAFWTFWLGLVISVSTLAFGVTASVLAGLALVHSSK